MINELTWTLSIYFWDQKQKRRGEANQPIEQNGIVQKEKRKKAKQFEKNCIWYLVNETRNYAKCSKRILTAKKNPINKNDSSHSQWMRNFHTHTRTHTHTERETPNCTHYTTYVLKSTPLFWFCFHHQTSAVVCVYGL